MIDRAILYCLKNRQYIKILLALTTLLILFLTLLPASSMGNSKVFDYDKIGHFGIFFGWTLLYGLFMFTKKHTETKLLLIFLAGCFFGISIEIFQGILPIDRHMELNDALVDIGGSLLAIGIIFLIKKRYLSSEMEKQLEKI